MFIPDMVLLRQQCDRTTVRDISAAVSKAVHNLDARRRLEGRGPVAVTAGSRNIAKVTQILGSVVSSLEALGCRPFIVPAMGSHGGATASGQQDLLGQFGITQHAVRAPIRSSMEVEQLGATSDGTPLFMDKAALEADGIIVVNRVKAHTKFFGNVESGLTKMTLIGLGKALGAAACHLAADTLGFGALAERALPIILKRAPIMMGLALVENALGGISVVEGVPPERFLEADSRLLKRANHFMARLPFREVDLLIVDRMGKDISGTGMDVNVIGARDPSPVKVRRIFVRDLSERSKGNAHGIGFAHVTRTQLIEKMDRDVTLKNARTALREEAARVPAAFDNDRTCIEQALQGIDPQGARIVRITDTAHLLRLAASASLLPEIEQNASLRAVSKPAPLAFDDAGNLLPLFEGDASL